MPAKSTLPKTLINSSAITLFPNRPGFNRSEILSSSLLTNVTIDPKFMITRAQSHSNTLLLVLFLFSPNKLSVRRWWRPFLATIKGFQPGRDWFGNDDPILLFRAGSGIKIVRIFVLAKNFCDAARWIFTFFKTFLCAIYLACQIKARKNGWLRPRNKGLFIFPKHPRNHRA